jgi:hypothetical protein
MANQHAPGPSFRPLLNAGGDIAAQCPYLRFAHFQNTLSALGLALAARWGGAKPSGVAYTTTTGFSSTPIPLISIFTMSPSRSVKSLSGTIPVPVSNTAP